MATQQQIGRDGWTSIVISSRRFPSLDEQIRSNRLKTKLLFGLFAVVYGIPVALIVLAAKGWPAGDSPWPLLVSVSILGVLLWFFIARAERQILRLSGAKRIYEASQCPRLYKAVDTTSIAGGIPPVALYLIDDPQPNAFAFGRSIKTTVIGATTGLLDVMDDDELEAICAHEVAHIRNGDTRLMTYASAVVSLMTMIAVVVTVILMIAGAAMGGSSSSSNSQRRDNSGSGGGMAGALVGIAVMWAFVMATNLIRLAISRNREYLADATAVELTKYPDGMVSALASLLEFQDREARRAIGADSGFMASMGEAVGLSLRASSEHLFAVPLMPRIGWISRLFSTHPPLDKRIERLLGFVADHPKPRRYVTLNPNPSPV